jgi:ariadne-1
MLSRELRALQADGIQHPLGKRKRGLNTAVVPTVVSSDVPVGAPVNSPAAVPSSAPAATSATPLAAAPALTGSKPVKRRKFSKPTYECDICGTTKLGKSFPNYNPSSECEHNIHTCKACLKMYVNEQIEAGHTKTGGEHGEIFGIPCPECDAIMREVNIEIATSEKMLRIFQGLQKKYDIDINPAWRWCLAPECKAGQTHKAATEGPDDICTCHKCGARACVPCDRPYHDGESCAAYKLRTKDRLDEEDKAIAKIKGTTKKCPNCKVNIEKNGGCSDMYCKYLFGNVVAMFEVNLDRHMWMALQVGVKSFGGLADIRWNEQAVSYRTYYWRGTQMDTHG